MAEQQQTQQASSPSQPTQPTTQPQPQPTQPQAPQQASQEPELDKLRRELAELRGSQSQAELAKARQDLEAFRSFRADVEAGVRQDVIRQAIPAGLPDKAAQLLIRGISAELGAFDVDVTTRTAKEPAKIAAALQALGLDALRQQASAQPATSTPPPGMQVLPPPVTGAQSQRGPAGVLKPAGGSAIRPPSLASSIAGEVVAAIASATKPA